MAARLTSTRCSRGPRTTGARGISCFLAPGRGAGARAPGAGAQDGDDRVHHGDPTFDDVELDADRLIGRRATAPDRAPGARLGPARDRRGRSRAGPGVPGGRRSLRQGAADVRPADHRAPGPRFPARRYGRRGRERPGDHARGGPAPGPRAAVQPTGVDRQARRHRHGDEGLHRCRAGARRRRLHRRTSRSSG